MNTGQSPFKLKPFDKIQQYISKGFYTDGAAYTQHSGKDRNISRFGVIWCCLAWVNFTQISHDYGRFTDTDAIVSIHEASLRNID